MSDNNVEEKKQSSEDKILAFLAGLTETVKSLQEQLNEIKEKSPSPIIIDGEPERQTISGGLVLNNKTNMFVDNKAIPSEKDDVDGIKIKYNAPISRQRPGNAMHYIPCIKCRRKFSISQKELDLSKKTVNTYTCERCTDPGSNSISISI